MMVLDDNLHHMRRGGGGGGRRGGEGGRRGGGCRSLVDHPARGLTQRQAARSRKRVRQLCKRRRRGNDWLLLRRLLGNSIFWSWLPGSAPLALGRRVRAGDTTRRVIGGGGGSGALGARLAAATRPLDHRGGCG